MNKLCLSRLTKVILISSFSLSSLSLAAGIKDSNYSRTVSRGPHGVRHVTYIGENAQALFDKHPEIAKAFTDFMKKAAQTAAEKGKSANQDK